MKTLYIAFCTLCLGIAAGYLLFADHGENVPQSEENEKTAAPAVVIPTETDEKELLMGTWRSADDVRFVRMFGEDGTVIDEYEGMPEARSEGTWRRFSTENPEEVPFTVLPGIEYVRVAFAEEMLYFTVTEVTPLRLELVYLGTGETLQFDRVR